MSYLCTGLQRASTLTWGHSSAKRAASWLPSGRCTRSMKSCALMTAYSLVSEAVRMPACLAMLAPVVGLSPVSILTVMPARWQSSTAPGTSGLTGSSIPMSPTSTSPCSMSSSSMDITEDVALMSVGASSKNRWAMHSTRRPPLSKGSFSFSRSASDSSAMLPSSISMPMQLARSTSGAPFTWNVPPWRGPLFFIARLPISLRLLEKGSRHLVS
mmetsp:Transcript_24656/g.68605  ORF Transcript_24656/g.68605 Transcript_24656/m.68605 type:complete len:214 (-) Transcript_24656:2096-2737(-)